MNPEFMFVPVVSHTLQQLHQRLKYIRPSLQPDNTESIPNPIDDLLMSKLEDMLQLFDEQRLNESVQALEEVCFGRCYRHPGAIG